MPSAAITQLQAALKRENVEFVFAQSVDMYGVPKAKLVPVSHLTDLDPPLGGAFYAGFATYGMGQGPADPDLAQVPDLDTPYTILPWRPDTARLICDVYSEGKPWRYDSRTILKGVIRQAEAAGYRFNVGIEPEVFLVKRLPDGGIAFADDLDQLDKPCYDLKTLSRSLEFVQTLSRWMDQMGWDVIAADKEDANAQFEIDFTYSDVLTTCDRYAFFRYMAGMLAHSMGLIATFMPKPFGDRTGNGAHFHMSLIDKAGKEVTADAKDPRGLGLSQIGYWFIGGLLKHAAATAAFTAPTVNSYKRLISIGSTSGATWAPVTITYGRNNRTQMIRVPGGHMENRTVDSSCNPYLAAAAMLAAGLDGIEKKIDPGKVNERDMYELSAAELRRTRIPLLPTNLKEAIESLRKDDVIRKAVGTEYADYYCDQKLDEWRAYHNTVSPWEISHYLTMF